MRRSEIVKKSRRGETAKRGSSKKPVDRPQKLMVTQGPVSAVNDERRNIKPEDLYILHLSDLHISKGILLHAHLALIRDVRRQLSGARKIVLVVTGDIVEQCDYSKKNRDAVCRFFKALKESLPVGCSLLSVEIVPGNHEVELPVHSNGFNKGKYCASLDKYEKLERQILKTVDLKKYESESCVSRVDYHGKTICFVRVDTSWTKNESAISKDIQKDLELHPDPKFTTEEKDRARRQVLTANGKHILTQKSRVSDSYHRAASECEISGRPIACTIALSHYPITWLLSTPCEKIQESLYARGLSDVNVWLCGHAHQAQLYYNNDDSKSTLMLMTGVGRDRTSTAQHRYSIYRLNIERNIIDVKIRSIGIGLYEEFDRDDELYKKMRGRLEYITFPLASNQTGAFHQLNSPNDNLCENILLDKETIDVFREVSLRTGVLYAKLQSIVYDTLLEFEDAFMGRDDPGGDVDLWLKDDLWLYTHSLLRAENSDEVEGDYESWVKYALSALRKRGFFKNLLLQVASEIEEVFTQVQTETGLLAGQSYVSRTGFRDIEWRVHIRRYKGCGCSEYAASLDEYEAITLPGCAKPKDAPYDGVISAACEAKENLVVKSVVCVENPIKTDWSDFLTGVPDFPDNFITVKSKMGPLRRPLLTYGISVRYLTLDSCRCASRILCGMDFAMLNRCLSYILLDFARRIKCDFRELIIQLDGEGGK